MIKSKPIIAIDIDDTLAEFAHAFFNYHNHKYHTTTDSAQITSFNAWINLGCAQEVFMDRIYEFYHSPEFVHVQPVTGAPRAIKLLKQQYELLVVSARPSIIQKQTHAWIQAHFPNTFSQIILTNQFSKDPAVHTTKLDVCKKYTATYFIDDTIENTTACSTCCQAFLYNRPWNQTATLPANINRVHSWNEVINLLLRTTRHRN